jgi:hypothetical protein
MLTISQLTPAQQQRFLDCAAEKNIPVDVLLEDFYLDPYMQGAITGTLPWCGLFGLVEADGRSHT